MKRRLHLRMLLCLGFLLGQMAAIVHATHHELSPDRDSSSCQVCATSHGAGGIPVTPRLVVCNSFVRMAGVPAPLDVFARPVLACPHGTGPPPILA